MKRTVGWMVWLLAAGCGTSGGGSGNPTGGVAPRGQEATRPTNFIAFAGDEGGGAPVGGALSSAAEDGYTESCVESTDEEGNRVFTCDWDGIVCTETYTPAGDLIAWDCGDYGRYECLATSTGFTCTYSGAEGPYCDEQFDAAWNLLSSTCRDTGGGGGSEDWTCVENADASMSCHYEDGDWTCDYLYSANAADAVLLSATCDGEAGSVACTGDAEALVCEYAYTGYAACTETYPVLAGEYGLLGSTCDWDLDGAADCSSIATAMADDAASLVCAWNDGETECEYVYGASGVGTSIVCVSADYRAICSRDGTDWVCEEVYQGQTCENRYDVAWNYLGGSCDQPQPVEPVCYEGEGVTYISRDPLQCAALTFDCNEGTFLFSDSCGCGCIVAVTID